MTGRPEPRWLSLLLFFCFWACALAAPACSSGGASAEQDAGGSFTDGAPSPPSGQCNAVVQQRAIEGFTHVAVCSHVDYVSKPPSSGNHYPIWSAYRSYAAAIPEGYWVHNLEHGGIVFSYNCPNGCDADIQAAQAYIDAHPADPACTPANGDARVRFVMTPDPSLDTRFAASAWGWTLRADCFDEVAFGAFADAHYGQGREAICSDGQDLSTGVDASCGQ